MGGKFLLPPLFRHLQLAVLVITSGMFQPSLGGATPEASPFLQENDIEDSDAQVFYPIVEDENTESSNGKGNGENSTNITRTQEGESSRVKALFEAVKQVFKDAGYTVEDMRRMLINGSAFQSDGKIAESKGKSTATGEAQEQSDGDYSLGTFKEKMKLILRKRKGSIDELNKELGELMRVLTAIEFDDLSETLNIMADLKRQDFPDNRTLLIAMIQAAVEQWGSDYSQLPPPFGNAPSNAPLPIPSELKSELYKLSQLLSPDLRQELVAILEKDQHKERSQIKQEMATIEETERGTLVTSVTRTGNSTHGTTVDIISNLPRELRVVKREERGSHEEFTLAENLQLDDDDQDSSSLFSAYLPADERNSREASSSEDSDLLRPERLEAIIRQEKAEARMHLRRHTADTVSRNKRI